MADEFALSGVVRLSIDESDAQQAINKAEARNNTKRQTLGPATGQAVQASALQSRGGIDGLTTAAAVTALARQNTTQRDTTRAIAQRPGVASGALGAGATLALTRATRSVDALAQRVTTASQTVQDAGGKASGGGSPVLTGTAAAVASRAGFGALGVAGIAGGAVAANAAIAAGYLALLRSPAILANAANNRISGAISGPGAEFVPAFSALQVSRDFRERDRAFARGAIRGDSLTRLDSATQDLLDEVNNIDSTLGRLVDDVLAKGIASIRDEIRAASILLQALFQQFVLFLKRIEVGGYKPFENLDTPGINFGSPAPSGSPFVFPSPVNIAPPVNPFPPFTP